MRWKSKSLPLRYSPRSPRPAPQQGDDPEVVEHNDDDKSVPVEIRGFSATAYKDDDIWVPIEQIQDVQPSLCVLHQAHSADLKASFGPHDVDHSRSFIPPPLYSLSFSHLTLSTFWITKKGEWC